MTSEKNHLKIERNITSQRLTWEGPTGALDFDDAAIKNILLDLDRECFVVESDGDLGVSNEGQISAGSNAGHSLLCQLPPLSSADLGDSQFKKDHQCRYAAYSGSMAHGISSEELVLAMGKAGLLASFGAGGVVPAILETTIQRIQKELPNGPYAFNLIYNPFMVAMEKAAVELYLKYGVHTVEASAYMDLTPFVVYYRVAGLRQTPQNNIEATNNIITKVSRREVAAKFMAPAPEKILAQLVQEGLITREQANMAAHIPMADDVTVEADSGGHTDNRPLVSLLPSIIALRNEMQDKYGYARPIRVGAAGGISTPESALAAFMMGAAYVVTGSVNQACVEAGVSPHVKNLLGQAEMADVIMAPAFDMLEIGGKLQVLKRGTFFPMRANKLAELYNTCRSIEEIPEAERKKLESQVFRKTLDEVWQETVTYFNERDPEQIRKAEANPKKKMALVFRWYLGHASHWANNGEPGREMDYQIWCGPGMGAFNDWVRGSYLEDPNQRKIAEVTRHILTGAAYQFRLQTLKSYGVSFPSHFSRYIPQPF